MFAHQLPSGTILYPDGTAKPKPEDRDRFYHSQSGDTYTWDDMLFAWVDSKGEIWRPDAQKEQAVALIKNTSKANGCECGTWVTGVDKHSDWCPLYR